MELFPDHEFEPKPELTDLNAMTLPKPEPLQQEVEAKLVDLSFKIRQLKPWTQVHECELFGIEDPVSGELNWCSVLGGGGEVFSIQFHEPPEAVEFWHKSFQGKLMDLAPGLTEIRLLEVEYLPPEEAETEDREMLKKHSKQPENEDLIPCFRDFTPGFAPWFIEQSQAEKLCLFLELFIHQFENIYPKYDEYHELGEEENSLPKFPVYRLKKKGKAGNLKDWQVAKECFPMQAPAKVYQLPETDTNFAKLNKLPIKDETWEIASIYIPDPISDGDRPYFAKIPLCLRTKQGTQPFLYNPEPYGGSNSISDTEALRGALADTVIACNYLPSKIRVGSEIARLAMIELADAKDIQLVTEPFECIDEFVRDFHNQSSEAPFHEAEELIKSLPPELQTLLASAEVDEQLAAIGDLLMAQNGQAPADNILPFDFATTSNQSSNSSAELPTPSSAEEHYQFRVTINGIKDLYRTFTLPIDATYYHLHQAIQDTFAWESEHLFEFSIGKDRRSQISVGFMDCDMPLSTRIDKHLKKRDGSFKPLNYIYDFGDEWNHKITIAKKTVRPKKRTIEMVPIGGKGIAPPEDCGSVHGYYALMADEHPWCDDVPEYWQEYFAKEFKVKDIRPSKMKHMNEWYQYQLKLDGCPY